MDIYKERYGNLLSDIIDLSKCWFGAEKLSGNEVFGECAADIQDVIEKHAEQK